MVVFSRNGFRTGFHIFSPPVRHSFGAVRALPNETEVRELELFTVNDGDIYRQITTPILDGLARKMKKGTYDHARAAAAYAYLLEMSAKKHVKEFGTPDQPWHVMFNKTVRDEVARRLADHYLEQVKIKASR